MALRARHVVTILVVAITAALLLAAMPASVTSAAGGAKACRVWNADQGIGRDSLQKAVWVADPGDRLVVRGTCVGTTLIKKDLTIRSAWVGPVTECDRQNRCQVVAPGSGRSTLKSGSWRPSIVVDPRVTALDIDRDIEIRHGVVVDDIAAWKNRTRVAPPVWRSVAGQATGTFYYDPDRGLRACSVYNLASDERFGRLQQAVNAASAGDHLSLQGKCAGPTVIDKNLHIQGVKTVVASSITCGPRGCTTPHRTTTGVPVVKAVTVAVGVDDVTLKHLKVRSGFAVE